MLKYSNVQTSLLFIILQYRIMLYPYTVYDKYNILTCKNQCVKMEKLCCLDFYFFALLRKWEDLIIVGLDLIVCILL